MSKKGKVVKKSITLKKLKELSKAAFINKNYEEALRINEKIIDTYPKNGYGYKGVIKAKTHEYNHYLEENELKNIKKTYDDSLAILPKKDKEVMTNEFSEYVSDCKEVENLRRIKKEITGKELLRMVHQSNIAFLSQSLVTVRSYKIDGKRIKNVYDFIGGLFLFACLIFNLLNCNYLLFLTVPFGVFGIINVYSFIDMNFLKKGKIRSERRKIDELIFAADKRFTDLKDQIKKLDDNLKFLYEQKSNTILKIPHCFEEQIKEELSMNEEEEASKIYNKMLDNNACLFTLELEDKTNISVDDIELIVKEDLKKDDELSDYINSKSLEKKNKQNELLYMKKITLFNVISTVILLVISIFSIASLANDFYEINFVSFIIACIIGIISMLSYNIGNGKHKSLSDTFGDNLLSCTFCATLVYDLVYSSITNELKITYGFVQMPLIFILVFMGFVMFISLLKYNYFLKRLRGKPF